MVMKMTYILLFFPKREITFSPLCLCIFLHTLAYVVNGTSPTRKIIVPFVIHIDTISVVPDFHNCDMCSMVMAAMIVHYGNHDDPGSRGIVSL